MQWVFTGGCVFLAFVCGSIPTGYLIVKALARVDIRTVGSGNIGSTNVRRIAGRKAAVFTQVVDVLKGAIPVAVGAILASTFELPLDHHVFLSITALAAILGHDFTPFLGFRGGKGVNTTVGSFVVIATLPTAIAVGIYFLLRLSTGIVSVGSIVLGIALPVAAACFHLPPPIVIGSALAGGLIVILHRDNLRRLMKGEERPMRR